MAPDVNPTWRQQQAAATRDRIAEAARALFAAGGYSATSMEAIAREAGVASRTVYVAYGTKRDILSAICEAWLARADARARAEIVLAVPDARDRLRAAVEWLADLYAAGFDVVEILDSATDESAATQELLRAKLAGRDRIMNEFMRSLRPELAIPLPEAQSMYRALASAGIYRELVVRSKWDRARFCDWLDETLARAILA